MRTALQSLQSFEYFSMIESSPKTIRRLRAYDIEQPSPNQIMENELSGLPPFEIATNTPTNLWEDITKKVFKTRHPPTSNPMASWDDEIIFDEIHNKQTTKHSNHNKQTSQKSQFQRKKSIFFEKSSTDLREIENNQLKNGRRRSCYCSECGQNGSKQSTNQDLKMEINMQRKKRMANIIIMNLKQPKKAERRESSRKLNLMRKAVDETKKPQFTIAESTANAENGVEPLKHQNSLSDQQGIENKQEVEMKVQLQRRASRYKTFLSKHKFENMNLEEIEDQFNHIDQISSHTPSFQMTQKTIKLNKQIDPHKPLLSIYQQALHLKTKSLPNIQQILGTSCPTKTNSTVIMNKLPSIKKQINPFPINLCINREPSLQKIRNEAIYSVYVEQPSTSRRRKNIHFKF